MSDLLAHLARWAADVVYYFGYPGVAVLMVLSNLHLPIPSQLVLPFAGFLVGEGRFSFFPVLAAATVGAVSASLVLYFPGRLLGEERLRRFVGRFGRFVLVDESDLDKAGGLFERHGGKAVLIGHLIPGVGAFVSIPAGLKRMPFWGRFFAYTVLGSVIWNVAFIALGWGLGSRWRLVERYAPVIEYAVLAVVVGAILWFVWRRWRVRE